MTTKKGSIISKHGGISEFVSDTNKVWCSQCQTWAPEEKSYVKNGFVICDKCNLHPKKNELA